MSAFWILLSLPFIFGFVLLYTAQQKLQREMSALLGTVGALKFRVFDHEAQLLQRKGVFIPEDTAQQVFNLMWNLASEQERISIQVEYKKLPEHIPLWKFVIHTYQLQTQLVRRGEMGSIDSPSDIIMAGLDGIGKRIAEVNEELKSIQAQTDAAETAVNINHESESGESKPDEER